MEKYGRISGIDKPVSRLFFGCAIRPMNQGEDVFETLDAAFKEGINAFDTARVYGHSEEVLGRWIKARGNREKVVLLTKGAHPDVRIENGEPVFTRRISREEIRKDVEHSLLALGVNEIDLYLLHRDDERVPAGEIAVWLDELVKEGKILVPGVSNWRYDRIREAREYAAEHGLTPLGLSSPQYSLAELSIDLYGDNCRTLTGQKAAKERENYQKDGMPVLSYASLAQGFFSGNVTHKDYDRRQELLAPLTFRGFGSRENFEILKRAEKMAKEKGCTLSQLALRWLFTRNLNLFAAVGSTQPRRMAENWAALDIPLTKEEADFLSEN